MFARDAAHKLSPRDEVDAVCQAVAEELSDPSYSFWFAASNGPCCNNACKAVSFNWFLSSLWAAFGSSAYCDLSFLVRRNCSLGTVVRTVRFAVSVSRSGGTSTSCGRLDWIRACIAAVLSRRCVFSWGKVCVRLYSP